VTVLVRQELWDAPYVARAVARGGGLALGPDAMRAWMSTGERARIRDERRLLERLLARDLSARPVLWEPGDDAPPSGALAADMPLFRLQSTAAPPTAAHPLVERIAALLGDPRDPLARRLQTRALGDLGRYYAAAGDAARATPLFDAALHLRPDDAAAALNLAIMRARSGDPAGALRIAEEVLEREPDRLPARLDAGRFRVLLRDLDGAAREFDRARTQAPSSPAPLVGLGRVARARGDDAAARRFAEAALALAPADPDARALLDELGP
jgi:tetratricopeptide (TPR) repeat protein